MTDSATTQSAFPVEDDEQYQARIEEAATMLNNMTPEALLEMLTLIQNYEDQVDLKEAGGIAFCEMWGKHGGRVNLTARAVSPTAAIDKLVSAIRFAEKHYGLKMTQQIAQTPAAQASQANKPALAPAPAKPSPAPAAQAQVKPEPQYVSVGEGETTTAQVQSIQHVKTPSGASYLKVRTIQGTKWNKFGVSAWNEVFPKGFDISLYQMRDENGAEQVYEPTADMNYAVIGKVMGRDNKEHEKVLRFQSTP